MIALSTFAQDAEKAQGTSYIASLDLFSLSGGSPDIRFEVSLSERSSISMRVIAFEDDSLHATLGVLSYRIYPIQGIGNAPSTPSRSAIYTFTAHYCLCSYSMLKSNLPHMAYAVHDHFIIVVPLP